MTEEKPGQWWRKWPIRLAFLIALGPVVAVFVFSSTPWGRDRLRDAAIEAIRSELGLRATLQHVDVDVLPVPELRAHGIVLDDPVYGRFAEADALTIRPSLLAFLSAEVDLHTIEIDGAVVNLVMREGELRNLPRTRGTSEGGSDLPFDRLVATGARITLDADPIGQAVVEGVNLELDVDDGTAFDFDVTAVSGRFEHLRGTERLQALGARGHLDPDEGLDLDAFHVKTPHLEVRARAAHLPLPVDDRWGGRVEARLDLGHLASLPHGWELPELEGVVAIEADLEGMEEGPAGEGTIAIEGGAIDGLGLNDVSLRIALHPDRVELIEGVALLIEDGGRVPLSGELRFTEGYPLSLAIGIEGLRFPALMKQLDVTPNTIVQWDVDGEATLEGTTSPLDLAGTLEIDTEDFLVTQGAWHETPAERVVGVTRARLTSRVSVREDGLRFLDVVADTPRSRLQGDVLIGFDNQLQVSVHAPRLDLADASPLTTFPIGGKGTAQVEVTGTFDDTRLTGHIDIEGFTFNDYRLGHVQTDAQLEEDGLAVRFPEVRAVKDDSRYRLVDLLIDFTNDRFLTSARLVTPQFTLADLYHVFGYEGDERFVDYQGTVAGEVDIRYTRDHPGDGPNGTMVASMDLAIPEVMVGDYAFGDGAFRGSWTWKDYEKGVEGGELDVEHLHLQKGDGVLNVRGRMGLGTELQLTATADRIQVSDTEGIGDRFPDLGGFYGAVGEIRGTADVPRVDLEVAVTGLHWRGVPIGDGRAYVRLTDRNDPWVRAAEAWDPGNLPEDEPCAAARSGFLRGRWNPDPPLQTVEGPKPRLVEPMAFLVCGDALDGQVEADVAIGRTDALPLRGAFAFADLDLAPFLEASLAQADDTTVGTLTGEVTFTGGAVKEDHSLSGRLRLTELRFGQEGVELRNDGLIDVRFQRGDFEVAQAGFVGPSSRLRISGGGSQVRGLALELGGEIDLGVLATLSPRFTHAAGSLDLRVNLSGPVDAPRVYGQALVRQGAFRYAGFPEPITGLSGEITFSARRILFERFRARVAGGEIVVSGAATLAGRGIDRYEFDVAAEDIALHPTEGVEVALGGQVELDWTRQQRLPLLHGVLRLDRVVYSRSIQLSQTLSEMSRRSRAEVEQYDPEEDRVEIDVRLVDEQPMRVATNLIDAEVRIEDSERPFRIVGTDQRFGAVGTLVIPRGTVRFRNTDFEVRRGAIDFEDTYRIDPNFDVVAVTQVRRSGDLTGPSWRIRLHAHGNRDAFQLDTSSEPELSQEDVILLLTIGMTRAEAEQLQAGDLTGTAALEALASVTGIDREVQRAVPVIDDFRITSRYSPHTGRTEPQIAIGKRIAERVRLSASTGLSETREIRTSVEWRLSDQTSVQAVYDNVDTTTASALGNVGFDVRWRLEFE